MCAAPSLVPGDTLLAQAMAAQRKGQLSEAAALYRAVLAASPDEPTALINLANLLRLSGDLEGALAHAKRAIARAPTSIAAWSVLGDILAAAGCHADAARAFGSAIAQGGNTPELHNSRGMALRRAGDCVAAVGAYGQAIALRPDYQTAHINLGVAWEHLHDYEQAADCARRALSVGPPTADIHRNLGIALQKAGRLDDAIAAFRTAVAADPASISAHVALGIALLLAGRFEDGWAHYDWHRRTPGYRNFHAMPGQPWHGEPCAGHSLLVFAEQGFGDTVQFARSVPALLRYQPKRVVFAVQPELQPLLAASFPDITVVARGTAALPACDLTVPLLSLPRLESTRLDSIPTGAPAYLTVPPEHHSRWRRRVAEAGAGFRLGLVWGGNPQNPNDANRSLPLALLAPLLSALPGMRLFSLQPGGGTEFAAALPQGRDLSGDFTDFADTAAAIGEMDLCLSVDTACAHLAGALGRPVWVMLPFAPDWRWLADREDSPWYPSMRLLRQSRPADWTAVLDRLRHDLDRVLNVWSGR
jgi:Flp pilus assembly protein TadD